MFRIGRSFQKSKPFRKPNLQKQVRSNQKNEKKEKKGSWGAVSTPRDRCRKFQRPALGAETQPQAERNMCKKKIHVRKEKIDYLQQ